MLLVGAFQLIFIQDWSDLGVADLELRWLVDCHLLLAELHDDWGRGGELNELLVRLINQTRKHVVVIGFFWVWTQFDRSDRNHRTGSNFGVKTLGSALAKAFERLQTVNGFLDRYGPDPEALSDGADDLARRLDGKSGF